MIEIILVVSAVFWSGAVFAIWARYQFAQYIRRRVMARRLALGLTTDDDFLRPCGFACQECIDLGYPKEFCGWFL